MNRIKVTLLSLLVCSSLAHASAEDIDSPEMWLEEYATSLRLSGSDDADRYSIAKPTYDRGLEDLAKPIEEWDRAGRGAFYRTKAVKQALQSIVGVLIRKLPEDIDPDMYSNEEEAACFLLGSLCHKAVFEAHDTWRGDLIPVKNAFYAAMCLDRFIIATDSTKKAKIANKLAIEAYDRCCELVMNILGMPEREKGPYVQNDNSLHVIDMKATGALVMLMKDHKDGVGGSPAEMALARFTTIADAVERSNLILSGLY